MNKSLVLVVFKLAIGFAATAQADSTILKKVIWEFDQDQPSFFTQGILESGYLGKRHSLKSVEKGIYSITNKVGNPAYSIANQEVSFSNKECLAITKKTVFPNKNYTIHNYIFSAWKHNKHIPNKITLTHYDSTGKFVSNEEEVVHFDGFFNPVHLEHYYLNHKVYEEFIAIDPTTAIYTITRKNTLYDTITSITQITPGFTKTVLHFQYFRNWNSHFRQRLDSILVYTNYNMSKDVSEITMIEKYFDSRYLRADSFILSYAPAVMEDFEENRFFIDRELTIIQKDNITTVTTTHKHRGWHGVNVVNEKQIHKDGEVKNKDEHYRLVHKENGLVSAISYIKPNNQTITEYFTYQPDNCLDKVQ